MTEVAASAARGSPRSRRRWLAGVVALLLVASSFCWDASRRTSAGPAAGAILAGQPTVNPLTTRPFTLRIGTFNIHGGVGRSGVADLSRTAESLRGLDLAGLNEVQGTWGGPDQAESLGRHLGLSWLFAPAERRWWHDSFGNGVLSRLPVSGWLRIPLPCTQQRGFRNALLLRVPAGGRTVQVLITHVDRERDRAAQLHALAELFLSLSEPAILMGDLNTPPDDELLRPLLTSPGVEDAVGQRLGAAAPRHIDWILLRGLHCRDAGMVDTGASDHPAVWAEVAAE